MRIYLFIVINLISYMMCQDVKYVDVIEINGNNNVPNK